MGDEGYRDETSISHPLLLKLSSKSLRTALAAVLGGLPRRLREVGAAPPDMGGRLARYGLTAAEDGGWSENIARLLGLSY